MLAPLSRARACYQKVLDDEFVNGLMMPDYPELLASDGDDEEEGDDDDFLGLLHDDSEEGGDGAGEEDAAALAWRRGDRVRVRRLARARPPTQALARVAWVERTMARYCGRAARVVRCDGREGAVRLHVGDVAFDSYA